MSRPFTNTTRTYTMTDLSSFPGTSQTLDELTPTRPGRRLGIYQVRGTQRYVIAYAYDVHRLVQIHTPGGSKTVPLDVFHEWGAHLHRHETPTIYERLLRAYEEGHRSGPRTAELVQALKTDAHRIDGERSPGADA